MSLTDFVIMPGADYKAICDSVRAKTRETKELISGEISPLIDGISGGGSGESSDLVKYVSFMDETGTTELFKMPVLNGDDCKDPISHGDIERPTKASTNTQNFTHSGWSLTSGAAASSSALANVTEDRIVYAAFTASVRYYTINYYDDDNTTLFKTVKTTYGADVSDFVPEKDGYEFVEWNPSVNNITSDVDTCAVWIEGITFASSSWEKIAEISESGQAKQYFKIGDTKNYTYGSTMITCEIVGFDHDDLSDGTGKAGISIMNKVVCGSDTLTNVRDGVPSGKYNNIQSDLRNVVKSVNKVVDYNDSSSSSPSTKIVSSLFWIPSVTELGGDPTETFFKSQNLGETYELYLNNKNSDRIRNNAAGSACDYWSRHYLRLGSSYGAFVTKTGTLDKATFTTSKMLLFGFCI